MINKTTFKRICKLKEETTSTMSTLPSAIQAWTDKFSTSIFTLMTQEDFSFYQDLTPKIYSVKTS